MHSWLTLSDSIYHPRSERQVPRLPSLFARLGVYESGSQAASDWNSLTDSWEISSDSMCCPRSERQMPRSPSHFARLGVYESGFWATSDWYSSTDCWVKVSDSVCHPKFERQMPRSPSCVTSQDYINQGLEQTATGITWPHQWLHLEPQWTGKWNADSQCVRGSPQSGVVWVECWDWPYIQGTSQPQVVSKSSESTAQAALQGLTCEKKTKSILVKVADLYSKWKMT